MLTKRMLPLKIAIVDDDPLLCWFWQITLERRYGDKIQVATFSDPHEALAKLDTNVSLILLDWHMPQLDGKTFLERARQRGIRSERVIIFSGSPVEMLHGEFHHGDCLAVIEKGAPDQEAVLVKIIDELVGTD